MRHERKLNDQFVDETKFDWLKTWFDFRVCTQILRWLSTWSLNLLLTVISKWERDSEVNTSEFNCQDAQFAIALKNQMIIFVWLYAVQNSVDTLNNEKKMKSAEEFNCFFCLWLWPQTRLHIQMYRSRLLIENMKLWVVTTSIKINLKRRVKFKDKRLISITIFTHCQNTLH